MSELDELISRDGVLMAGRLGPDGRITDHKSRGLFIEYPPAIEMAQRFCATVTAMFESMAFAMDRISSTGFDDANWLPVRGWAFFGKDYSIAVHGDRFVVGETEKITSLDELRRLLREVQP